jgi:hypothetical protein
VGGCFALVQLLKNCLDKAIEEIPACDQVTELDTLTVLTTLEKTLIVITRLTFQHDESKVGITATGGVEAVVKVMKTFPKCQKLQDRACTSLRNLACCSSGKTKATESGGIEVLLDAVNNHVGSALLCRSACMALLNIVRRSKENTRLLISLCGGAAVAKVSTQWPDNNDVRTQVRKLEYSFAAEWKARADEK